MVFPDDELPSIDGVTNRPTPGHEAGAGPGIGPHEHEHEHEHEHDHEVVEDDHVAGGWDAWDVTPPMRRRRADPLARFDHHRPDRMLVRAASLMLVTWRMDRGMRQHEAAAALGIKQSWLSRIERDRAAVSVDLLARIAAVTGSSVTLQIVVPDIGYPVRRVVTTGRSGRAGLELVVLGPEERCLQAPGPGAPDDDAHLPLPLRRPIADVPDRPEDP